MDEKIRFLEEKRLAKTIAADKKAETETEAQGKYRPSKCVTNPITAAFLKFIHTKHKFNIEDL